MSQLSNKGSVRDLHGGKRISAPSASLERLAGRPKSEREPEQKHAPDERGREYTGGTLPEEAPE